MSDTEKLAQLSAELQKGLHDLEGLKANLGKITDAEAKLDTLAKQIAANAEAHQTEMQKMQARIERSAGGGDETETQAAEAKGVKQAFADMLRKGDVRSLAPEQLKLLTSLTNPDGGYMVPNEMGGMINGRIFQTSPIRLIANVVRTSNKSIDFTLDDQEAAARWASEAPSSQSETNTPQVGNIEITARKLEAYPSISQEMLADAMYNVEAWLQGKLVDVFSRSENTAFVNGVGVDRPRGFLTYANYTTPGTYQRDAVEQIANGSTSAISETALIDLMGALKAEYHDRATWVMNQATFAACMKVNGANSYRFINLQPANGPTGFSMSVPVLFEKPVVLASDMPTIASNALAVAFGDFGRGYTIVDRQSVSVLPDPFTLPGRVRYYATKRTGGAVTNFEAIKLLRMSVS